MPKVKLGRDPVKDRTQRRRNLIESKAHLRGYRNQSALARALNKPNEWASRRLRGVCAWSAEDLLSLDKLLQFSAEELAEIVRGA